MLNRFLSAQKNAYAHACSEITAGQKQTHWMWFVFPQLRGLGHSDTAQYYGIAGLQEAEEYLAHPVLGTRLREITLIALSHEDKSALQLFGYPDNLKFHSSMTLFQIVSGEPDSVFAKALDAFFAGKPDEATVRFLNPTH